MSRKPEDLKFTKEHEWICLEGDSAVVGLTAYAAEQLGDVVHVELPQPHDEYGKEESFGVVESVKSVSDTYMPVGGKILMVNEKLLENAGIINEDPYNEGWLLQIQMTNPGELELLMSHEQYQTYISEES